MGRRTLILNIGKYKHGLESIGRFHRIGCVSLIQADKQIRRQRGKVIGLLITFT